MSGVYPEKAPRCFPSQAAWELYRESAILSADKDATYCTDCTASYHAKMVAAHRCRHPETQFIVIDIVRKI